ncbi:MAG: PadR family transcriptional regulator [Firmicutes bacterium]|nr:PadR family transcriptional regulator [Bacillota bacterium]
MREIKSDYMRGSINNIILHSLLEGDKYGYEIIKEVEERSNGQLKIKQPSLYSALNRLSDRGLIDGYVRDSAIGGKRRYFSLTELGREQLNSNKDAWVETRDSVDSYILNKPSEYQNIEVDKSPAASSMPKIVEAGKTGTSVETFGKKKPETAVTMVSFGEGKKPEVENLELSEDEINDMIDESLINHTQMSTHFEESFERLDDGALVKVKTKTTRIMCEEKVRSANNKVNITLIIANEDGIGAANDASEEDIDMILDALVTSDAKVRTHTAETLEKDGDKIYKIKTKQLLLKTKRLETSTSLLMMRTLFKSQQKNML